MLMPKKVKYRKQMRGRRNGKAWRGGDLAFGEYGLKAMENAWITDRQIEASRVAITRFIKRGGKLWIRIFPDKPFTKKPAETRMGKGKGAPEKWVSVVRQGRIMFGADGGGRDTRANCPHRQSNQREDAKNDRGGSAAAGAAPQVPPGGAHLEKVLRARRKPSGQARRHGAHRSFAAAFQVEALAVERSADAERVGLVRETGEETNDSDAKLADGGRQSRRAQADQYHT